MGDMFENLSRLMDRGGVVMVPLVILSVVAIGLIIERSWFWISVHGGRNRARLSELHRALRAGREDRVRRILKGDRSPYARLVATLMRDGITDAVAVEAAEAVRPRLDRFMVALSTIITAAPLLGILGTVIGIIRSFNLLGTEETLTDPRVVSVGIAEALVTTALGLVVALMTLFPYMLFKGHVERSIGRMESLIAAAQQGLADRGPVHVGANSASRKASNEAGGGETATDADVAGLMNKDADDGDEYSEARTSTGTAHS